MLLDVQDSERLQLRSHDLEHQLSSKEKELEGLFQKQKNVSRYYLTLVPHIIKETTMEIILFAICATGIMAFHTCANFPPVRAPVP